MSEARPPRARILAVCAYGGASPRQPIGGSEVRRLGAVEAVREASMISTRPGDHKGPRLRHRPRGGVSSCRGMRKKVRRRIEHAPSLHKPAAEACRRARRLSARPLAEAWSPFCTATPPQIPSARAQPAHNTWQSTCAGSTRAGGGGARRRRTLEGVGVGARDAVPRLRGAPMHVVDRVRIVVLDASRTMRRACRSRACAVRVGARVRS